MITFAKSLVTAPTVAAVSYPELRAFLRLPDDNEIMVLDSLVAAAQAKVEADTSRRLITQTWDLLADAFPVHGALSLPFGPLQSVTSLKVTSLAGVVSTVAATVYQVDTASDPARVGLADGQSWPSDVRTLQGIAWRVVVGYGADPVSVPEPLRLAIMQLVAQWYACRTAAGAPLPPPWMGYDAMIAPYKIYHFA